ncbi:hypothetical protein MTO96_048973 [Rhipicephalus appendiculatus]
MSASKGKEISQVSLLRSSPGASPMHSVEAARKPTLAERKYKVSTPGAHSPSRHKQRPPATRQPEKPTADAKQEAIDRNIDAGSNERGLADQQKPLDQKYAMVSEGIRAPDYQQPVYYRRQRYPVRQRTSLWNPMVNQAKPPLQASTVQGAVSHADYIVPNYVRAPEVPPESRCISVQVALIGALTVFAIVMIIAWTVVILRQSDARKEPAGQHETGHGQTHGWLVSQSGTSRVLRQHWHTRVLRQCYIVQGRRRSFRRR